MGDRLGLSTHERVVCSSMHERGKYPGFFYKHLRNHRLRTARAKRSNLSERLKPEFVPPEYCAVHWDGSRIHPVVDAR